MEDQHKLELIDNYIQGVLSEEERLSFEARIKTDSEFAKAVEEAEYVDLVVMGAGFDRLREQMSHDISVLDQKNNIKNNWLKGGLFALSISIIALIFIFGINEKRVPSVDKNIAIDRPVAEAVEIPRNNKPDSIITHKEAYKFAKSGKKSSGNNKITQEKSEPQIDTTVPGVSTLNKEELNVVSEQNLQHVEPILVREPKPEVISCKINFAAVAHATCSGQYSGEIEIVQGSIHGAEKPFHFTLEENSASASNGRFNSLSSGTYYVVLKDKNNCTIKREVFVPEKICSTKTSYSIIPDNGETWKFLNESEHSGKYTILNKAGIVIFKANFSGHSELEWNGTHTNGEVVSKGVYVCILEYVNGKSEHFQITVIK